MDRGPSIGYVRRLAERCNNWGRCGDDEEIGTVKLPGDADRHAGESMQYWPPWDAGGRHAGDQRTEVGLVQDVVAGAVCRTIIDDLGTFSPPAGQELRTAGYVMILRVVDGRGILHQVAT